jgi:hypothetical protein
VVGVSRRLRTKFGNARTSDVSIKSWSWPPRGSHHALDKTDHESARQDGDHSDRLAHYPGGVTEEPPAREDLAAAIGARRELGKEYEALSSTVLWRGWTSGSPSGSTNGWASDSARRQAR